MSHCIQQFTSSEIKKIQEEKGSQIKLIFFDIDGTLVNSKAEIPDSAIKEIEQRKQQGIHIAIASGRPAFAAQQVIDKTGADAIGLFYTGAMVYDPLKKQVLEKGILNTETVMAITEQAKKMQMHCELYTADNYYSEVKTKYTDYHTQYLKVPPVIDKYTSDLLNRDIYKLLLVAGNNEEKEKLKIIQNAFPEITFATGHGADKPDIIFSSIVSKSANKKSMFQKLCKLYQLEPKNIMSFGDAGSDKDFLDLAGLGVAMGNAQEHVKSVADYTTKHVDDDGIAYAIKKLLP